LADVDNLSELPALTHLSLVNNPVSKQKDYRLYMIHKFPKLKLLDYHRVKPKEKKEAVKLFGASKEVEAKIDLLDIKASTKEVKTFVPGEGVPKVVRRGPTPDQRKKNYGSNKKCRFSGRD